MMRQPCRRPVERATDREVGVVAAVLVAGSEKAAAHRLGPSHSTVKYHLANAWSKVGAVTTAQLDPGPAPARTHAGRWPVRTSGLLEPSRPDQNSRSITVIMGGFGRGLNP